MNANRSKPQVVRRKGVYIKNNTHYNTRHIAAIVAAAMKEHRHTHGARKNVNVTVTYTRRSGGSAGLAWYHTGTMKIRLSNPTSKSFWSSHNTTSPADAARVIEHELFHCMGYCHTNSRDQDRTDRYHPMPDQVNRCRQETPWADGLPLAWEPPAKKAKPTGAPLAESKRDAAKRRVIKYNADIASLKAAIKRKEKLIKEWEKKARHHERRIAALTEDAVA